MPRFMGFVRMEEGVGTPPQSLFDAMDAYIGEQAAKGVFLDGGGLYGTEDAVNFVVRKGEVSRVDGPYAEAKEVVGGWAIMQYDTVEEAVADQRGVRRAAREALARGHRDRDAAPDLQRPGGARRLNGSHYAGLVPAETSADDPTEAVYAAWRAESARLVGALTRMTRDVELAEDLAQDALVAALEQWPTTGVPENPGAWLMTIAKRRGIDHFRRADNLRRKVAELEHARGGEEEEMPDLDGQVDYIEDDVLRLIFLSCHPSLTRRVPGRADAAPGRRAHHRRDRPRVPGHRVHDGPAHLAGQEDAVRGPRRVRAAHGGGADQAPRRRHGRDLPDLQRGLHRHRRRGLDAPRPGDRGDEARAHAGRRRSRRARGARTAGAARDPGLADGRPGRRARRAGPAGGAGPDAVGPAADPARAGRPAAGRAARRAREAGRDVLPAGLDRRAARPRSSVPRTRTGAGSRRCTTSWPTPRRDRSSR